MDAPNTDKSFLHSLNEEQKNNELSELIYIGNVVYVSLTDPC